MLRAKLLASNRDWFSAGNSIRIIESDLGEIDVGLARLQ
jgi:hypothetical protein